MGKREVEASTGMGQNRQEINMRHMVSPAMCCGQDSTAAGDVSHAIEFLP
jgi:hypothetical protein